MKILMPLIVLLLVLPYKIYAASCNEHEWYAYPNIDYEIPPNEYKTNMIEEYLVDRNYVSLVDNEFIPQANKMLENEPYIKINPNTANSLVGYKVWLKKESELYLLRGIKAQENAEIKVYFIKNKYVKNEVRVISFTMGELDKVTESPVVVSLPEKPMNVFTYCIGVH